MKKVKLLLIGLFATVLLPSAAQQPAKLPADNAIRQGKLPNGLTYYIRHNAEPKGQVNFYIAQKVGSIQENDDQRGLAHFLEHMAFNGSKHFPNDGQLIKYCESIGVKFGENLNAYTSTDETVYNIDNVPVAGNNVDSCLFILADWSGGLLLQEKEINKERGVIHEEWRMSSSPMMRIFERRLPELYPGSKYGYRLPIGLMSIVDNFKPDFLRAYYKKWYRPDLQGVVIVGDIDAAQVEAKVKQILGAVPMPANAAKYETYPVPDNAQAIYVIDKDKEQTTSSISIMLKTDVLPQEYRGTLFGLIHSYMISMMGQTLNGRLNEMSQKQDCPFISAGVDYGTYLLSKTKDAFSLYITPKPGRDAEAVTAVMKEVKRLKDFGVTGTELLRARDNFLSTYETLYNNRDKQKNGYYVERCVRDFLDGTGTADIATLYNNYKLISGKVNKQVVDDALRGFLGQPRQGAVGAHAARVGALVAVAHALEVLGGLEGHDGGAVGEAEEGDLGSIEVVLDDDRSPVAGQAGTRVVRGLGAVGGHDDSLAGSQGVVLDDVGRTQIVECGLDLVHGGAGEGAGGSHAGIGHDLLRERLGGLESRRVLRRAEHGDPVVQHGIGDARDERGLRADDHEVDLLGGRASHDILRIHRIHGEGAAQLLQRRVTGLDDKLHGLLGGRRSHKRSGDRVFATPVTNEKDLHDSSLSVFGGLAGRHGILWVHVTAVMRRGRACHQPPFGLPLRCWSSCSRRSRSRLVFCPSRPCRRLRSSSLSPS